MADNEKQVVLDFEDWRYDEWTFDVEGEKYSIKKGGTEVPADKEQAIKKAAQAHPSENLKLRKVG